MCTRLISVSSFVLAGLLLLGGPAASAAIWYVDVNSTMPPVENGTSWSTAFNTLQEGIDAAATDGGGEVWVAQGTYGEDRPATVLGGPEVTGSLLIKNHVFLYGGFQGGETARDQRDWRAHETIIDGTAARQGSAAYHVIVTYYSDSGLDGFTVSGGRAVPDAGHEGYHTSRGGGMFNYQNSASVANCVFSGNSAQAAGGAVHNEEASAKFNACGFLGNTAASGAGVMNSNASAVITNCVFADQTASNEGAGIESIIGGSPVITNCTIIGNTANLGGGILNGDGTSPKVTNCILWGNLEDQVVNGLLASAQVTYCLVQGGFGAPEAHNIDADPGFADLAVGDIHLGCPSQCIDAGTNANLSALGSVASDADGNPRAVNGSNWPRGDGSDYDLGAYEYQSLCNETPIEGQLRIIGPAWVVDGARVELRADHQLSGQLTFQWQKDGGVLAGQTGQTLIFDSVLPANAGAYQVFVDDGTKTLYASPVFTLQVFAPGTLPLTGGLGLAGLAISSALAGVAMLRRRR